MEGITWNLSTDPEIQITHDHELQILIPKSSSLLLVYHFCSLQISALEFVLFVDYAKWGFCLQVAYRLQVDGAGLFWLSVHWPTASSVGPNPGLRLSGDCCRYELLHSPGSAGTALIFELTVWTDNLLSYFFLFPPFSLFLPHTPSSLCLLLPYSTSCSQTLPSSPSSSCVCLPCGEPDGGDITGLSWGTFLSE